MPLKNVMDPDGSLGCSHTFQELLKRRRTSSTPSSSQGPKETFEIKRLSRKKNWRVREQRWNRGKREKRRREESSVWRRKGGELFNPEVGNWRPTAFSPVFLI